MKSARHLLGRALLTVVAVFVGGAAQSAPDAVHGEQLYGRCLACHALTMDRVGPRHCGLLGRRAGSVAGFDYSTAMKRSGLIWTEATLNRFLTKPLAVVPGSSMTYDGIASADERRDLIAYLKRVNDEPACRGDLTGR